MDHELVLDAARAMARLVDQGGERLTLRQLKERTMPRSSWEHFEAVVTAGHRAGVLVLSRVDLPAVYGSPGETGIVRSVGACSLSAGDRLDDLLEADGSRSRAGSWLSRPAPRRARLVPPVGQRRASRVAFSPPSLSRYRLCPVRHRVD